MGAGGAGMAIDAIKKLRANRALLKKKGPFQIQKENRFIKRKGKKFTFKQMTPAEKVVFHNKVLSYKRAEKKRLIIISALTIIITIAMILLVFN